MKDFERQIRKYCIEKQLLTPGDHVIAGVSGGADSVCLLLVLKRLQQELRFTMEAVHVEHGLRGEESLRDAAFVEKLCSEWEIVCHTKPVDVAGLVKAGGLSTEEAARRLRYEVFEERAGKAAAVYGDHAVKIAVAHNRNDQAETILFHLLRGSGLAGMAGMRARQGRVVRPLLEMPRARIEQYLQEAGQDFCCDSTNGQLIYSRNRLRHEVIPLLEQINPQACTHVCRFGETAAQTYGYMEEQIRQAFARCVSVQGAQLLIPAAKVSAYPEIIQDGILYEALTRLSGSAKDISTEHIRLLKRLLAGQSGRELSLPCHVRAVNEFGLVVLQKQEPMLQGVQGQGDSTFFSLDIKVPGQYSLPDGRVLTFAVREFNGKMQKIPGNYCMKWYDYDKIKSSLKIRYRRAEDYFYINGQGQRKKLKRYFIEEKIPKAIRDNIPLVAAGGHILWVVGYRSSDYAKVTDTTEHILEIQLSGGNENG